MKTRAIRLALAGSVICGLILGGPHFPLLTAQAAKGTKPHLWHIKIGVNFFYAGILVNKYFPDTLTIHAGDSVQWTNQYPSRAQTVTFGPVLNTPELFVKADGSEVNPQISKPQGGKVVGADSTALYSSGALAGNVPGLSSSYTFTFPSPGRYLYRSLFHPAMLGEIDVVPGGKAVSNDPPDTGSSYFDALRSADKVIAAEQPEQRDGGSNGNSAVEVEIGGGDANISMTQFNPAGVTIKAGNSVTWVVKETSGDPHDLYFSILPKSVPMYTSVAPDGGLVLNPGFAKTTLASGTTVTTDTLKLKAVWNSGILYGSSVLYPSATPSKYTLTFAVPGRYSVVDPFIANNFLAIDVTP